MNSIYNKITEYISPGLLKSMKRLLIFLLIYTAIFWVLSFSMKYAIPFVIALVIAILLKPVKNKILLINNNFKKFKISHGVASAFLTIGILILLGVGIFGIGYKIIGEMSNFLSYISSPGTIDELLVLAQKYFDSLLNTMKSLDPAIVAKLNEGAAEAIKTITSLTSIFVKNLLSFAVSIPTSVIMVFITIISTFFFLKDIDVIIEKLKKCFSTKGIETIKNIKNKGNEIFAGYIKAYILIMLAIALISSLVYAIAGVKYALPVAILTGILDILPLIGAGMVYLILGVVMYLEGNIAGVIILAIGYVIVFILRQFLEQQLVSSFLGIHPLVIIIALFITFTPWGVTGMFYFLGAFLFFQMTNKPKESE